MDTLIFQDKVSLGRAAAERAAAHIRAAIAEHGEARVIFASAASQFEFIEALLARADIDWSRVCGFHLDEYVGLSADHPPSFRSATRWRQAQRSLNRASPPAETTRWLSSDRVWNWGMRKRN